MAPTMNPSQLQAATVREPTAGNAEAGLALLLLTDEGELHGAPTAENQLLARRIQAALVACEGLSTEDLEAGVVKQMCQMMSHVLPLLQERESLMRQMEVRARSA